MNKATETKFFDIAVENAQLYHNIGYHTTTPTVLSVPSSDSTFFNPWADIPAGTGRANRIGDKITPLSMNLKIWLANKADRPNVMYRVIVVRCPKSFGTTIMNYNNIYPFQLSQIGTTGNCMVLPLDYDKGFKPYYDRVFNVQAGFSTLWGNTSGKEVHKIINLKIKRRSRNSIVFDSSDGRIVNNPLALYIIPYDSYGTLITDNIASYSYYCRMYYKDA
jgi:hypothetical protein